MEREHLSPGVRQVSVWTGSHGPIVDWLGACAWTRPRGGARKESSFTQTSCTGKAYFCKRNGRDFTTRRKKECCVLPAEALYSKYHADLYYLFFKGYLIQVWLFSIKSFCALINIGKVDQSLNSLLTFTYIYVMTHRLSSITLNHFAFLFPLGLGRVCIFM